MAHEQHHQKSECAEQRYDSVHNASITPNGFAILKLHEFALCNTKLLILGLYKI
jgi:hypothetical protein